MKKEKFIETYESLRKIEDLLAEAKELFDKLPTSIQQAILNYHNEPATIQYCLRWGLQATNELRKDWHTVVAGLTVKNNEEEAT